MQTKKDACAPPLTPPLPHSELRRYCGLCKPQSSELYSQPGASQKDRKGEGRPSAVQREHCVGEA